MKWANTAPTTDTPHFQTPHSADMVLAGRIVESLREDHRITFMNILTSPFQPRRRLGDVAAAVPEISHWIGSLAQRPMKTVVIVSPQVPYMTPIRRGNLRIKREGERGDGHHIFYCNREEAEKFATYGTATLLVVLQTQLLGDNNKLLGLIGAAIRAGRIDRLLIVTHENPQYHWHAAIGVFGCNGRVTLGYSLI